MELAPPPMRRAVSETKFFTGGKTATIVAVLSDCCRRLRRFFQEHRRVLVDRLTFGVTLAVVVERADAIEQLLSVQREWHVEAGH
jgi:hypothetical protein